MKLKNKKIVLILCISLLFPFLEALVGSSFTWRPKATDEKNYLIKKDFLTIDYTVEVHGEDSLLWSFHYEKNTPLAATQLQAQFWDENGIKELNGENFATKDGWLKETSAAFGNNQSKGTLKAVTAKDSVPQFQFDLIQESQVVDYQLSADEKVHDLKNPHVTKNTTPSEKQVTKEHTKATAADPLVITLPNDLTGWPINQVVVKTKQGNEAWQSHDPANPPYIFSDTSVQLEYTYDLDLFFETPAGQKVKEEIEANEERQRYFVFSFEISGDIYLEKNITENLTIAGEKRGEFTIVKNGGADGKNHLWTVTLNNENWDKENVRGEMNLSSTITVEEVTETIDIMVSKEADIHDKIQIKPVKNEYSLQKSVTKEPNKVSFEKENYHLVEWEIAVTPGRDKNNPTQYVPIKDLRITDEDISTLYPTSVNKAAGFYLPQGELAEGIAQHPDYQLFKIFLELDGKEKELIEGKDYKLSYDKSNDSKFSLSFYNWAAGIDTQITGPLKIQYTAVLKDDHPSLLTNQVQSNIAGSNKLEANAATEYYHDDLKKTSVGKGNGIIEWTVVYHRKTEERTDFSDVISAGEIDFNSLKILAEINKGQQIFPEITSTPDQYRNTILLKEKESQRFTLEVAETLPKGRYMISYQSKHDDANGQTLVTNTIEGGNLKASTNGVTSLAVEKKVIRQNLFNEQVESNFDDKTILWSASITTVPNAGEILINDAAIGKRDATFYKNGLFYYWNKAALLKSGEVLVSGKKFNEGINQAYLKEKGIIVAYEENGEFVEIQPEEITIDNGKIIDENGKKVFDSESGVALVSKDLSWSEKGAGFSLKIDEKYAGKKIWLAIASKYGGEAGIVPQQPIANYFYNTIEAIQANFEGSSRANTSWTNNAHISASIRKIGTMDLEENRVDWEILANTRGYEIKAGDEISDHMNVWKFEDNSTSLIQTMTIADLANIRVHQLKIEDDGQKNSTTDWFHDYTETLLTKSSDYEIIPLQNSNGKWHEIAADQQTSDLVIRGFTVRFKKDMRYSAFKVSFSSRLNPEVMAAENGNKNQILNTAALITQTGTETTANTVTYQKGGNGIYKSAGDFDTETTQLPWQVVVNPEGAHLYDLIIEDISTDQVIIPGEIKLYYANLEYVQISDKVWEAKIEKKGEVEAEVYQLACNENGFKIEFAKDFAVTTPLIIEYSGKPKKADQSYIENKIKMNWAGKYSNSDTKKVEIRNISASGTISGEARMLTIKKHSQSDKEVLAGAKFVLEKQTNGSWQTVNEKQAQAGTSTSGLLTFTGLKSGNYRMKEIVAPAGYELFSEYVYFKLNDKKPEVTDENEKVNETLQKMYSFTESDNQLNLTLNVANEKQPSLEFNAYKVLKGMKGAATFDFILKEKATKEVIAYGEVNIKENQTTSEIVFYTSAKKDVPIKNWRQYLLVGKTYSLEEVSLPKNVTVTYYNTLTNTQTNEFTVEKKAQTLQFRVTNTFEKGFMPATGGQGTRTFIIVALILSLSGICLGGYYGWRNFRQKK